MNPSVRQLFDRTPINEYLGFRLVSSEAEGSELTMELRPELKQEGGKVHGGMISTFADTTAVYAIAPTLPDGKTMTSIEFKLNFVRSADLEGPELVGRGKPVRVGRKVALAEVEVSQDERLVAKGLFTYLVFDL